ncbi:XRE family transcriptional regulator [Actinomadura sp. KC06]|uniref:phage tail assembly protein n=1 Tax=Actinomadura sp. KC06 TaxID=2530369 RepID=UPI00104B6A9B|nr:phage tail assembly protein [Actinomadura sp. KC06]TDD34159.1 XRE family transcriptional regulator [Actinomadura sp. KC06]
MRDNRRQDSRETQAQRSGVTISDDPEAFRAVRRSELDAVTCGEELARLLAEQYARADVSLRELELRSNKAGGTRLARATCSDMLAGRRFPKKAVMVAFLRACQVPEEQLADWARAWERVRIAQLPTAPVSTAPVSTTQVSVAQLSSTEPGGPVLEHSSGELTGGSAIAGQNTQPVMDKPVRGRKPVRRRIGLLVGLIAATVLATAIGLLAFADPGSPPRRLTDDGRAFSSGGSSQFIVAVDPAHTEIRLTRRLDAIIAGQTATITVNGALAAVWQPLHGGPRVWKNQSVVLPSVLTVGRRQLTITNTFVSSELDFNEFTYFVDQKIDGDWSRADTVNVGTEHAGSEAAHHYRITNQTWVGTRDLNYLR